MSATNDNTNGQDATTRENSPRKVLGQLSTNVQFSHKKLHTEQKKISSTGPQKRTFSTAIGDHGFSYLKRRRLSSSTPYFGIAQSSEVLLVDESPDTDGVMHVPHRTAMTQPDVQDESQAEHIDRDRDSSSERHSFSSLINYDPSSQTGPSSQGRGKAASPEDSQIAPLAMSRAELLRIRLRIAMYKIRTNQTEVPFDYLREDTSSGSRESSKAVQEAVEQLRQEAYARLSTSHRPSIATTPTSPILPSRSANDQAHLVLTPDIRKLSPSKRLGLELTSSAVKGQVAEGLLGLKHGF